MPSEPGKCYALCYLQNDFIITKDSTAIYSNIDNVKHLTDTIQINSGSSKWVKKKVGINCLSANPEVCYVWFYLNIKEIIIYQLDNLTMKP